MIRAARVARSRSSSVDLYLRMDGSSIDFSGKVLQRL